MLNVMYSHDSKFECDHLFPVTKVTLQKTYDHSKTNAMFNDWKFYKSVTY
jgi:hypothetical protein